jgi:hypothetical protein
MTDHYQQIAEVRAMQKQIAARQQGYERVVLRAAELLEQCTNVLGAIDREGGETLAEAVEGFKRSIAQLRPLPAPPPPPPTVAQVPRVAPPPRQAFAPDRPGGQTPNALSAAQRRAQGISAQPVPGAPLLRSAAQRKKWGHPPATPQPRPRSVAQRRAGVQAEESLVSVDVSRQRARNARARQPPPEPVPFDEPEPAEQWEPATELDYPAAEISELEAQAAAAQAVLDETPPVAPPEGPPESPPEAPPPLPSTEQTHGLQGAPAAPGEPPDGS